MDLTYCMLLVYVTAVLGNPCYNQTLNTVPYPHNCNTFVVCWMSKPYFQACPIGSLFDTITNNCQPWPIAICWHFAYPPLRHPLPPLTHARRMLPPISSTFITKYLPADVTTEITKIPREESTTEQQLQTKLTTAIESQPSNEKIATRSKEPTLLTSKTSNILVTSQKSIAEDRAATALFFTTSSPQDGVTNNPTEAIVTESTMRTMPSESTSLFKDTTTTLTPYITSHTLQPLTITTLIHKSKPTTNLSHPTSTLLDTTGTTDKKKFTTETRRVTSEPRTIITEKGISYTTEKLLPLITNTAPSQISEEGIHKSDSSTITPSTILSTKYTETSLPSVPVESTTPDIESATVTQSTLINIDTIVTEQNGITETGITEIPSLSDATDKILPSVRTLTTIRTTYDLNAVPFTAPTDIISYSPSSTEKDIRIKTTESHLTVITSVNESSLGLTDSNITFSSNTTTTSNELLKPYTTLSTKRSESEIDSTVNGPNLITSPGSTRNPLVTSQTILPPTTSNPALDKSYVGSTQLSDKIDIITWAINDIDTITIDTSIASTTFKDTSVTEINSMDHKTSTATGTTSGVTERKPTVPSTILSSATNGATVITSEQFVQSTAAIVTSNTDINFRIDKAPTASGTPTGVTERISTVPSSILTSATNAATAITSEQFVQSTASIEKSSTDINLRVHETSTPTGTPTGGIEENLTLPPTSITLTTNEETAKTSDQSIKSTVAIVTSVTDINVPENETSTATGTQTDVTEENPTLPPISLISTTNEETAKTNDQYIKSTVAIVTSITDITSPEPETSTGTSTPNGVTERKPTVPSTILSSATNGATAITNDQSVQFTASIETSSTDINFRIDTAPTASGRPTGVNERISTVPPSILTSATNAVTAITSEQFVQSTASIEKSSTDINLRVHETSTATGTPTGGIEENLTLPPTSITLTTNEETAKTSDQSIKSTVAIVTSVTDINVPENETSTATGKQTDVTEENPTLPPTSLISTTNEETAKTNDQYIKSTVAIVTSITDITSPEPETSTGTSTPNGVTERKPTVPSTILSSATNGATAITNDQSVQFTASIETSSTDINFRIDTAPTASGRPTGVNERISTVPPSILTSATNAVTAITSEQFVQSTASIEKSSTDINLRVHETSTATGTPTGGTEENLPLPPTSITSTTIEETAKTSDQYIKSTVAIVTSITDINAPEPETSTSTSTPSGVTERKPTVLSTILSSATNGATAITSEQFVQSTAAIVTSSTDINFRIDKAPTASGTPTGVTERISTVPPSILTSATNAATAITSEEFVQSTASIETSSTDINLRVHKTSTATGTPTGGIEENLTLPPTSITSTTIEETAKTSNQYIKSTVAIVTSITDINLPEQETSTATGTPTYVTEENLTVPLTSLTSTINEETAKTSDQDIKSTAAIVTSITDINVPVQETSTATGTPTDITEENPTLPPTSLTSTTNEETAKTSDQDIKSTVAIVTSVTDINSPEPESSTSTSTPNRVTERNPTLPPTSLTSTTNEDTAKTSNQYIKSTVAIVTSITDINLPEQETSTATGTPTYVTEENLTVPLTSLTSTINEETAKTSDQDIKSTAAIVTSITDINVPVQETSTSTGTPTYVTEENLTVPLTSLTSTINEETAKTSDQDIKSTVAIVTSVTDINSPEPESSTSTSTPNRVTERNPTLPPTSLTSTTNEETAKTSRQFVQSTAAIVTSSTDINLRVHETSTTTNTPTGGTEENVSLPSTSITSTTNEETAKTSDQSIKSTAAIVTSITDINVPEQETSTAIGTPTDVTEENPTLPPTSLTSTTNEETAKTSDQSIKSTVAIVTSVTDINVPENETSTATGTQTDVTEENPTIPPTSLISTTNEETAKTSDQYIKSTVAIVTSITDINSPEPETSTGTSTPSGVTERKPTVLSTILSSATNGATAITYDQSVQSTASIETSSTDINLKTDETSTASDTPASVIERKSTVSPSILNSATNAATATTSEQFVQSTASIVTSSTDINFRIDKASTASGTPTEVTERISTVPPSILTSATNAATAITSEQFVQSTAAIVTYPNKFPETITLQPITDVDSKTLGAYTNTENIESSTSAAEIITNLTSRHLSPVTLTTLNLTIPSTVTEKYPTTYTTKRPLPSIAISPKNLVITSNTSGDPKTTASIEFEGKTEKHTSGTERNPTTDSNMPATDSSPIFFISKKPLPDISTKSPLSPLTPTPSEVIDSSPITRIIQQENSTLYTRRILPPIPKILKRPCSHNTPSTTSTIATTSEATIQPLIPDCDINDNFLYPDLVKCNFYFKCFNGIILKLSCKPKFGFNPHLMKCIPEERARCGLYRSTADQRSYLISFLLFNQFKKYIQLDLSKENDET